MTQDKNTPPTADKTTPKTAKVSTPKDRATATKGAAKPAIKAPKPSTANQSLLWMVVLVLIIAVLGLGYMQWQAQAQRTALTSDQSGQSSNLQRWQQDQQALEQQLSTLSAANEVAQSALAGQQAALEVKQARMDDALVTALQNMAKTQLNQGQVLPQWQLAEAEYLLRLANQRLAMEQASESAVALLNAADVIIRDSDQVGTYGIRRAIATDLAALTAVPSVDVEGVYAQLTALSGLAAKLTFIPPQAEVELSHDDVSAINSEDATSTLTANANSEQVTWSQSIWLGTINVTSGVWSELKQLIKVQSRTQEDQQLLTPAAELLVRMRIEMALSQTQVALLRRQQTIYDQSLVTVKRLLAQYYRPGDAVAQAMGSQIDTLSDTKVLVNMPNISASLLALQGFIANLHDVPVEPLAGE